MALEEGSGFHLINSQIVMIFTCRKSKYQNVKYPSTMYEKSTLNDTDRKITLFLSILKAQALKMALLTICLVSD